MFLFAFLFPLQDPPGVEHVLQGEGAHPGSGFGQGGHNGVPVLHDPLRAVQHVVGKQRIFPEGTSGITEEEIVQWFCRYKYGNIDDVDYQKEIIDIFLNSIYVYDDRLVFTYNYRDGTETLTMKDIEAAFGSDMKNCSPPSRDEKVVPKTPILSGFFAFHGRFSMRRFIEKKAVFHF